MTKSLFAVTATGLTLLVFWLYLRAAKQGRAKPHVFSWGIWSLVTLTVFVAQWADRGGVGAWPTGVSGLLTCYVAITAYRDHGDVQITRVDWFFFLAALSALPIWMVTADPLWAVVVLTTVDVLGFAPTFRKAYHQPFSEPLSIFGLVVARNVLAIAALEHFSLATVLFPATTGAACVIFIAMVVARRRMV